MAARKQPTSRRSGCPLNAAVEILGDRWSFLILRDMMLRNSSTYNQFLQCPEKIATNILADRLEKLVNNGIITTRPDPADRRRSIYELTEKGMDLGPAMVELVLWAARHEPTGNPVLVQEIERDKAAFIARVREQWRRRVDVQTLPDSPAATKSP
jgi:DNA-binding HxlR family transcriptional regulator